MKNNKPSKTPLDPHKSRRAFIKNSAALTALTTVAPLLGFSSFIADSNLKSGAEPLGKVPWYNKVTRWGQINIT